jgi:hypothetical protein
MEQKSHSVKSFNRLNKSEVTSRKFILHNAIGVASDGAGTISKVVNMDPSASQDWGLISNYYDEFRVIAIRVFVVSLQQYSITKLNGLLVALMDNDTTTAATYVNALQYANKRWIPAVFSHQVGELLCLTFKRPEDKTSPIAWCDVATPASSLGSFQIISSPVSLTATTYYFNLGFEYMIEARGRR